MKKIILLFTVLSIVLFSFKPVEPSTWVLDKIHSKLSFTITHMMVTDCEGWFKKCDATLTSSKEDFSDATVEMTGDATSINTEDEGRDKHIKGPDFLDVEKFNTLTFKSKLFKKVGDNAYKVTGDFTLHGITKEIQLDVTCRTGTHPKTKKAIAGFKISGTFKRTDFGIAIPVSGAILSDEIAIIANTEFDKN